MCDFGSRNLTYSFFISTLSYGILIPINILPLFFRVTYSKGHVGVNFQAGVGLTSGVDLTLDKKSACVKI